MNTGTAREYRDTPVDVKMVLAALWTTMLFVFAYVDIFGFYRADVLDAALEGTAGTTGLSVDQVFLTATLAYILIPCLMVMGSLRLTARVNRIVQLSVSSLYALSITASCIGESWVYYLSGSAVEVALLAVIARAAWRWPTHDPVISADEGRTAAKGPQTAPRA